MAKYRKCPKCGHKKLLTASRTFSDFWVDSHPYNNDIEEDGEEMQGDFDVVEDVQVIILYCEKCDRIIKKWFGD